MVKKIKKYLKFIVCCALIMSLVAPSYAALSASDGSAFVTKAEFDSALADFNARLTTFEAGINSKIDSQVTSYLDRNGIWNGSAQTFEALDALSRYKGTWSDSNYNDGCWMCVVTPNKSGLFFFDWLLTKCNENCKYGRTKDSTSASAIGFGWTSYANAKKLNMISTTNYKMPGGVLWSTKHNGNWMLCFDKHIFAWFPVGGHDIGNDEIMVSYHASALRYTGCFFVDKGEHYYFGGYVRAFARDGTLSMGFSLTRSGLNNFIINFNARKSSVTNEFDLLAVY